MPLTPPATARAIPLCVDLDGTLLNTDTLWETAILQLKTRPWRLVAMPVWLARGRARLKAALADGATARLRRFCAT